MARSYRRARRLSPDRRRRLMRVFLWPMMLRVVWPAMALAFGSAFTALIVARTCWPNVDTEAWPFIIPTVAGMFAVALAAWAVANTLFIRWLIRYRTGRHGRTVAMGDILRRSDRTPSTWRRLVLKCYGVNEEDQRLFQETLQP